MSTHLKTPVAIAATEANREPSSTTGASSWPAPQWIGCSRCRQPVSHPFALAATNDAIRPFRINVPEEALVDLRPAPGRDPLAREGDRRR